MGMAMNLIGIGAAASALLMSMPLQLLAAEDLEPGALGLSSRLGRSLDSVAVPKPDQKTVLTPAEIREVSLPVPAAILPPPKLKPVPSVVRVLSLCLSIRGLNNSDDIVSGPGVLRHFNLLIAHSSSHIS